MKFHSISPKSTQTHTQKMRKAILENTQREQSCVKKPDLLHTYTHIFCENSKSLEITKLLETKLLCDFAICIKNLSDTVKIEARIYQKGRE